MARQADVRREGTPIDPPAQKLPTLAPEEHDPYAADPEPVPSGSPDRPQVRGKGPKGRERRPPRRREKESRPGPAKAVSPRQRPKKPAAERKAKTPAGPKKGSKKGGRKSAKPAKKAAKKGGNVRSAVRKAAGAKGKVRTGAGKGGKRSRA